MRLHPPDQPAVELTYCTNVHRCESLPELLASLRGPVTEVKALVCPDAPFATGIWLSAATARALEAPGRLEELRGLLGERGLYVPTLNGFPFGSFHGTRVKEQVCEPDWRDPARREHTLRLARILSALLPESGAGSISTVPGAWKPALRGPEDVVRIAHALIEHVAELAQLEAETSRRITLALEPEPCCMLETIAETVAFFDEHLYAEHAVGRLAELAGTSRQRASELLSRHLGVCLDACHAAVEYENPTEAVAALRQAEIPIAKVQLSSALRVPRVDAAARAQLAAYVEPVYLHQVVARLPGREGEPLTRYVDLPEALASLASEAASQPLPEWRVHFHVPVFAERAGSLETTQDFLRALLAEHLRAPLSGLLEVETYTFEVLPPEIRPASLPVGIAQELLFCMRELGVTHA